MAYGEGLMEKTETEFRRPEREDGDVETIKNEGLGKAHYLFQQMADTKKPALFSERVFWFLTHFDAGYAGLSSVLLSLI